MGNDTIPDRADNTVEDQDWWNVFRRVLIGDFLPRDATGAVADLAGNLGSTLYHWLNHYVKSAKFKDSGFYASLEAPAGLVASYTLQLLSALPGWNTNFKLSTSGQLSTGENKMLSASSGPTAGTGSTSDDPITNLSGNITTSGNPVLVQLLPDGSGNSARIGINNHAVVSFYRDGVAIAVYEGGSNGTGASFLSSLFTIDTPPAGLHTYQVFMRVESGACDLIYTKLLALELF